MTFCDLNLSTDNLFLVFDEAADISTFNPLSIAFQNSLGNITLTSASSARGSSSSVIVVDLGLDADELKTSTLVTSENGIYVSLLPSAFEDIAGNSVQSTLMICNFTIDTHPPSISSFDLDLNSNLLQVRLSEAILVESLNISMFNLISSSVGIRVNMINLNDSYLLDCEDVSAGDAVRILFIAFGSQSLTRIKTDNNIGTTVNNTYLFIDDFSFTDTNGNSFVSTGLMAAAAVIADNSPATAIDFSLDMNIGQIVLTFNDVVDVSTWRGNHYYERYMQRSAYNYNTRISILGNVMSGNSNILIIDMHWWSVTHIKWYSTLIGLAASLSSSYLTINANAINDIRGADIIAVTNDNAIITNSYVRDSEPPQFMLFDLDMNTGTMYMRFDEPMGRQSVNFNLFSLQGDSIVNSSSSVNLSVSSTSYTHYYHFHYRLPDDVLYSLTRDPTVARNRDTTYLVIMQGATNDSSGNPINATGPIKVRYYTPGSSKL